MRIEFLFPELVTIYGEKANVEYLEKCLPDAQVVTTSLEEGPAFALPLSQTMKAGEDASKKKPSLPDLCYIGSIQEDYFEAALSSLRPYKKGLERYIKSGRIFLATGNAIDLFGKTIEWKDRVYPDGTVKDCVLEGLGLYDYKSVIHRDQTRHNSWYYGEYENMKIMGHRSTFSRIYGGEVFPFIKTLGGFGMNDETKQEGIHQDDFYATTLLGPLLIMNPDLTKYFIRKMAESSGEKAPENLFEEKLIYEAYHNRLSYLSKPDARYVMGALG